MDITSYLDVRKDLVRKNLVPKYKQAQMFDLDTLRGQLRVHLQTGINEYVCPRCQISIKGPKEWMQAHVLTHKMNQEKRDNEIRWHKVRVY